MLGKILIKYCKYVLKLYIKRIDIFKLFMIFFNFLRMNFWKCLLVYINNLVRFIMFFFLIKFGIMWVWVLRIKFCSFILEICLYLFVKFLIDLFWFRNEMCLENF